MPFIPDLPVSIIRMFRITIYVSVLTPLHAFVVVENANTATSLQDVPNLKRLGDKTGESIGRSFIGAYM